MTERITIRVHAADPISRSGVASQLRSRPEIRVLEEADAERAAVAVVVADEVDEGAVRLLRSLHRTDDARIVLVAARLDDAALLRAVEGGVCAVVRRSEASPERLVGAVRAAGEGDGSIPPDLLGRLLSQVARLQCQVLAPRGLNLTGLSEREVEVLRLIADGNDTNEIARTLCYSERTVKNVIHDVTTRLQLRNRSHAVAFAVRQGLI
ncbi:MAG: response regulator transcription factor [Actinomycetota bacterium]|nr:response regulator transcription factor [Actinomycetota bacterium]